MSQKETQATQCGGDGSMSDQCNYDINPQKHDGLRGPTTVGDYGYCLPFAPGQQRGLTWQQGAHLVAHTT